MSRQNRQLFGFLVICAIGFLMGFGSSAAETMVTKYAEILGALPSAIGLISSVCSVTALLVLPLCAPLLDAFNKKWTYIISAAALAIAYIGFAFSHSVNALIFFRLINGLGKGVSNAVCMAMASDILDPDQRTKGIVWCSLAMAISVAFAPATGLYIAEHSSYFTLFMFGAAVIVLTMIMAAMLKLKEGSGKITVDLNHIIAKESIEPSLLMVFLATAYSTVNSFIVVYATGMGVSGIGIYFTVYSLVLLISRPLITAVSKYISPMRIMVPAIGVFALSMYLISISRTLTMFMISAVVAAFGYGICQPLVQALCIEKAGEGRSGLGSSTSFIGTNIGYFAGPFAGGLIAEACGYSTMFVLMIVPLLFGALILIHMMKGEHKS